MRCTICGTLSADSEDVCPGCGAPHPPARTRAHEAATTVRLRRRRHHRHPGGSLAKDRGQLIGAALIAGEIVLLLWEPWVGVTATLWITLVWLARVTGNPQLAAASLRRPAGRSRHRVNQVRRRS